jgi:signal transduction protein with GAF and PtsI domain
MSNTSLDEKIQKTLSTAPEADCFGAVLKVVLEHFNAHMGTIHRLNAKDGHLYLLAASAGIPEPVLAASRRIPLGKGIAGAAAASQKPVSLCNLQTDSSGVARPGAKATGAHGALCVPIFQESTVVGTLGIGCQGDRVFTEAETEALLAVGRALAEPIARTTRRK